MAGVLYIVATPIGNLSDMTLRAKEVFSSVDFIAAEDTRVTVKLLNHMGIKKPMISYYEHNLKERGEYILSKIAAGENCALCSDAGMPAISDPGEIIVRDAHARGIKVVPIPAASAAVTALCVSGQATSRFVFEGFLPTNRRTKKERLEELKPEYRTIIFYEAPHKLLTTLCDMQNAFGGERGLSICRELTKLHEEINQTTIGQAYEYYLNNAPKGEFVLVMAGCEPQKQSEISLEDAVSLAEELIDDGVRISDAAKQIAAKTGFSKSDIYRLCTQLKEEP